jgi:hypothetical protein
VRDELERLVQPGGGEVRADGCGGRQQLEQPVLVVLLSVGHARVRVPVGQRQQDPRERDAIGDAVMHPRDQRHAVPVAVDHIDLPQRLGAIERGRHQFAGECLELAAASGFGQRELVQVAVQVEVGIVLPSRGSQAGARLGDALAEAREALDEALAQDR